MSNSTETTLELPFSFGEGFLQDHAGHIISDPRIALIELIANAYDAGATKVDLRWPAEVGQPFVLTDNGTGMSRPEFERRWKTLCYKRIQEQGLLADYWLTIPIGLPARNALRSAAAAREGMARSVSPMPTLLKHGRMVCPSMHASK